MVFGVARKAMAARLGLRGWGCEAGASGLVDWTGSGANADADRKDDPVEPQDGMATASASPTLLQLFSAFARLGLTSFGGGLSAGMMHEIVTRRGWVGEREFLNGLAIAQALPGVNVVNLPIWLGYRLRGGLGALVSAAGIVVPPLFVIILLAIGYESLQRYSQTSVALAGAASAAVGLALAMALRAARLNIRRLVPAVIMLSVFALVGVVRLPLRTVVAVAVPISIAIAWLRPQRS